jgi:hypothetical protein
MIYFIIPLWTFYTVVTWVFACCFLCTSLLWMHKIHMQGKTTPYVSRVNNIWARGKPINTTRGLDTQNNTRTPRQYISINNAMITISPSVHNMFGPQTAIFRYLSYAKTSARGIVHLSKWYISLSLWTFYTVATWVFAYCFLCISLLLWMHNIHMQGKTTPYVIRLNNIWARWKTVNTTRGLGTQNNTRTPRPLQYKTFKNMDNEMYCLDKWMMSLVEV